MEFSRLKLKAVRDTMIEVGWCRTSISDAIGTIRRCFKWAVENELIPASVFHGLMAISGLRVGRPDTRELDPVQPVSVVDVEAVLVHVSPQVKSMIELQLVTGMRPGEVCGMRTDEIDRTGTLWV